MPRTATLLSLVLLSAAAAPASAQILPLGEITAGGSASDDFALGPSIFAPGVDIAAIIERDRMYMAERDGFITKRLPFYIDAQGVAYSGGRYLFDSYAEAVAFGTWLAKDFILDGVPILERDYFIDVTAYSYEMIGGWRWQPVEDQVAMRVERWSTAGLGMPPDAVRHFLRSQLSLVVAEAAARGHSEVWLAYSEPDGLVSLTVFSDRVDPSWDGSAPDFATLGALAGAETMATTAMRQVLPSKVFDRASWVFTTWFKYLPGDSGHAALWPNSPPFPEPSESDGVCEPSRGESHANSPADCLPTCGDAVPDEGETTANCPSDVRLE